MVKEIYFQSEDSSYFYVRAITKESLELAVRKALEEDTEGEFREDIEKALQQDELVLDDYGYHWESVLIEHIQMYADSVDKISLSSDNVQGTNSVGIFSAYAKFCQDQLDKGNILVLG